jgi:hypothetical protein
MGELEVGFNEALIMGFGFGDENGGRRVGVFAWTSRPSSRDSFAWRYAVTSFII